MDETELFLGLTRPARFMGLPMGFFIGLIVVALVSFVAFASMKFLLIIPFGYGPMWLLADRNPNFFEYLSVVATATPMTRRRRTNGGDLYVS
ncbi:MAG: VirB3 family type IV secretion system protein [Paracoccaceae bacterium]|nr:VirB3 family type IV secretion system protein [Paracoccaceae bacterium]